MKSDIGHRMAPLRKVVHRDIDLHFQRHELRNMKLSKTVRARENAHEPLL